VANLGVNYKDAGRVKEALPLLEEAYRSSRKMPTLKWAGTPLLDARVKAGQSAAAGQLVSERLTDARNQFPTDSPQLAGRLASFGMSLLEAKAFTDAEPLLREALTIREKKEPDAWTTFNTQSMLGGALLGQKKYADAEPLLFKGYEGMKAREKTIPPQGKPRLPEALDRLIQLYTETNKPEELKKHQELRAKYPMPNEKK
jgi:tetratricopeptide (TPR) repeat protein